MKALAGIICALVCTTFSTSAIAAEIRLIGSDVSAGKLVDISLMTGMSTVIGPLNDPIVGGLGYDGNHHILYGSTTSTNMLLIINALTGATTPIGPLGVTHMHSVEYDTTHDVLYGATNFNTDLGLYSINVNTGLATLVGVHGIQGLSGMAYDPVNDILYGADSFNGRLYTLNRATGAATLVGSFNNPQVVQMVGLAYAPGIGLYGSDNKGSASLIDQLFRIDTQSGQATLVGNIGVGNVLGLTFVPEPSASLLLMAGVGALVIRRRR
ncbi:MAG: PEP-CTERM sorting domain-containing protein [Phycisphaerales bacterium]|nr:PEP-CTERM sorting domain-containing protein [Phycisphaerales bacterium]MCB9864205.1 PEP-CTERM sorting domain-containing protein [Phycisphaerales bacterium]